MAQAGSETGGQERADHATQQAKHLLGYAAGRVERGLTCLFARKPEMRCQSEPLCPPEYMVANPGDQDQATA